MRARFARLGGGVALVLKLEIVVRVQAGLDEQVLVGLVDHFILAQAFPVVIALEQLVRVWRCRCGARSERRRVRLDLGGLAS